MVFLNVPVIVSLLVACSLDYAVAEESKCITPTHYKEIGCTPIKTANESCPSSYNCDHLKDLADDKCHFRGKQLDDHQSPEALPPCVPYAFCTNGYFQPGHVDCGHTFRHAEEVCEDVKEGCCRHTVCGEELKKLHVCHADGKAHFQGEKWNPKEDKCMECVCDDKWSNATEVHKNANCKPYECFDDFWRIKEYKRGCAPMYYGSDRCCPSQTKCPSADDKLIKAPTASPRTDLKCKFGDLELQLGDGVNDSNNCMVCKCITPPLMECHFSDGCEQVFN